MNKMVFEEGAVKYTVNIAMLLDHSGSTYGPRINQLNDAMPGAFEAGAEIAAQEGLDVNVRCIQFADCAEYILGSEEQGIGIQDAVKQWKDIPESIGCTYTDAAIRKACQFMHTKYLGARNTGVICVLVTDGCSTHPIETLKAIDEMKTMLPNRKGESKVLRVAVGLQDANQDELIAFASRGNIEHEDGRMEENVPLVFNVENMKELNALMKSLTVSSIISVTSRNGEDIPVIVLDSEDDTEEEDWVS